MGFKENLKTQLTYSGILMKELAALTGLSIHTIETYLNVRSCEPSAENAVRIARVLGVSVEYLVTGEQSPPSRALSSLKPRLLTLVQEAENLNSDDMQILLDLAKGLKRRKNHSAHN
jgi:transcriptional regulator with XRE-family HTH domain